MGRRNVLMVVTSHSHMEDKPTGVWLSEFAEPFDAFQKEDFDITVASIKGGYAPIDPRSIDEDAEERWKSAIHQLSQTTPINEVSDRGYDAIFLPGGHGTMFDFPNNQKLQHLIQQFAETDRIVAAVCHGPAGFVNVKLSNGDYFVMGRQLTSFTDDEERTAHLDYYVPFLLEQRLRQRGAQFIGKDTFTNNVVTDEKLITGQNPQSGESIALRVINMLQ
ncbi:type 1 glutamine amidotransferase domain-containing protein [Salirhabdus salicampi]|uniref:type 1 glutamine amidotransferase domain-containing protein n=1 Tax=Salirhabdus salicampi TaxID=476102 RepID=UPI0020C4AB22|nr:type 1 glutamine amidotransferase domain-containing protein [Salirhabdus salicampi]MCP8617305.1 type 1 glutamine amidotransferase domain-containing protein [Salirhabdus salicampi]